MSKVEAQTVLVTVVVDASGSMNENGKREATLSGLNEYFGDLRRQAETPGGPKMLLTVLLFNAMQTWAMRDAVDMREAKNLESSEYQPIGGTPLRDAVMDGFARTAAAYARVEEADRAIRVDGMEPLPAKAVLFIVATDGEENQSRRYSHAQVVAEIEQRKGEGWTMAFIGAGPEAWAQGATLGVPVASTLQVENSARGMAVGYASLRAASMAYARSGFSYTDKFFDQGTGAGKP